jgi:hypothetical protein
MLCAYSDLGNSPLTNDIGAAVFRSASPPQIPIQSAVLDRLGEVLGADRGRFREIGDRAGDFQDAVVGAGN